MKSNIKLLVICTAVIVILAAAIILLSLSGEEETDTDPAETTTSSETLSKLLYDKDPALIKSISVTNETGSYEIVKYSEDSWFVSDFIGAPHSKAAVTDIRESAASLTSRQTAAENAEDMSVYGLDAPRARVISEFENGEKKELLIGADSPSAGLTYAALGGEKTVYAVNTADLDVFLNDRFYFLAKTVYTPKQPEDENDTENYTKINSITITRKDLDYDIVLEYDVRQDDPDAVYGNSSTHVMTSPVSLDLDPDKSYSLINGVFGLTADETAAVAPDEEMLAAFGLDDPYCEVYYDITGGSLRLAAGAEYRDESGKPAGRYCIAEGIPIVYMFSYNKIPWAEVMPMDITMTMITSTYIYTIDTLETETQGKKTVFTLSGGIDDFSVTCTDAEVTADSFKSFYQYILRAPAEELYLEECSDPADFTVTINHEYGTDKLEFINSDDRRSVIRLNGKTSFRCRTSYVNRLAENLDRLLGGEEILTSW